MNERPTPETDALDRELHSPRVLQDRYSEMRDHARRLERERDEWYYKAHANAAFTLEARAERDEARRERDEARELCRELIDLVAYGLGQSGQEWSLDAMRQAMGKIQKAKSLEAK